MMVLSELISGAEPVDCARKHADFCNCARAAFSGRKAGGQIRGASHDVNAAQEAVLRAILLEMRHVSVNARSMKTNARAESARNFGDD
jgi:hypothetical protein